MISGRRPKRPDGQYYRQSRKKRGGASRGRDDFTPIAMGFLAAAVVAVVAVVVWAVWFR